MFKENFSDEELNTARQNGFILTGKTGTGKSTLLNVIFGKDIALAKSQASAVTKDSQVYYIKLNNGMLVSLVDTPGLSDPDIIALDKKDLDKHHLKGIEKVVSEEKIHIKGILFLVNFHVERFDESEQKALLDYNKLFPLKRFWKHLVVIFTHVYGDPMGDSEEEKKKMRDESNGIIFSNLMQKVKDVSDVIDYKELNIKYYNSYSPIRKDREGQVVQNNKNKEDIENLMKDFCSKQPLFCQIEIKHIKNERIEENGKKYLVESEIIGFFDLNNSPIQQIVNIIKKEEIKEQEKGKDKKELPPVSVSVDVFKAQKNEKGELKHVKQKGDKTNSKYVKNSSAGIGGLGGAALGTLGGITYAGMTVGGATTLLTGLTTGITTLGASVLAAPVAIGAAAGAGIGYTIYKLFE